MWRDATRDHYSVGPGAVKCVLLFFSPSPAGLALGLGLAWLGLAAAARVLVCLAFGFRLLASFLLLLFFCSFSSARLCAWALAFLLLRACALGVWLLASLCLLMLRACVLGFWLGFWLLASIR